MVTIMRVMTVYNDEHLLSTLNMSCYRPYPRRPICLYKIHLVLVLSAFTRHALLLLVIRD